MMMTGSFAPDMRAFSPTLHHQGLLVPNLERSASELVTTFGFQIESGVIEDPVQTARVQFLRLPGGTSWVELVSPLGTDSKLSQALKKGGGAHHLCFEVGDIAGFSRHLRSSGWFPVSELVPAAAFPGRCIIWFMNSDRCLFEFLERGEGPLSLASLL